MSETLRKKRLEFHNRAKNSHKFYEVHLVQRPDGMAEVRTYWGRCRGYGRCGSTQTQSKVVVYSPIDALVAFEDWVYKKQKKGYELV